MSELMRRCVGRMEDVASSVRKSAFQLLCDLIRNNPFGIKLIELDREEIERKCAAEEKSLAELVEQNDKLVEQLDQMVVNAATQGSSSTQTTQPSSSSSSDQEMRDDDEDREEADTNRTVVAAAAAAAADVELQQRKQRNEEEILKQQSRVNYLKDMLVFITEIDAAIPKLSKMLFSKTQTDVLEVCHFFS